MSYRSAMLEVSELGLPPARLKIQTQNSLSPSTPTVLSVRDCGLGAGLLPSHLLPAVKVTPPRHAGTDLSLKMVLCLSVLLCSFFGMFQTTRGNGTVSLPQAGWKVIITSGPRATDSKSLLRPTGAAGV